MKSEQPIRLAGASLSSQHHICAFFNTPEEEYRLLIPFIREGLDRGEKAFHIIDPIRYDDHFRRLADAGIDTEAANNRGQLEVRKWEEAYLRGGHFDQNAMLVLIEEVLRKDRERFPLTRLIGHMEWALEDRKGVDDLVEYETRLNYILPKYKDPVI